MGKMNQHKTRTQHAVICDAILWDRTGSTLAQVMACCLTALNSYLNQCWLNHQWGDRSVTHGLTWDQCHRKCSRYQFVKYACTFTSNLSGAIQLSIFNSLWPSHPICHCRSGSTLDLGVVISAVMLFSPYSIIAKTNVSCWYLSNMNVIQGIKQVPLQNQEFYLYGDINEWSFRNPHPRSWLVALRQHQAITWSNDVSLIDKSDVKRRNTPRPPRSVYHTK